MSVSSLRSWIVILALATLCFSRAPKVRADDYGWLGISGSWTDPQIWVNAQEPMSQTYPEAGDVANMNGSGTISLDGSQSVGTANITGGTVALSGGSLSVSGTNLLRVGVGSAGTLDLLGASVSANGTLIGLDATGTMWLFGGSTLSEAHELDVGYNALGHLNIVSGSASSSGPVFVGGFQNGNGEIIVSGSSATLNANGSFMAVGNLGKGSLIVDSGGKATATNDFVIAGFASGQGGVSLYDSGSSLQVTKTLTVGSFGTGSLTVGQGASAMAKTILIGAGGSAMGTVNVNFSGGTLTASDSMTVGNDGHGELEISSGGKVNVQGFAIVGSNSTGSGLVLVQGNNSQLSLPSGALEIGRNGSGEVHVIGGGVVDTKGLFVASGSTTQASLEITGSGSKVDAHDFAEIGKVGTGSVSVVNSGQFMSQSGKIGTGGTGNVTVSGSGSKWTTQSLKIGDTSNGTLTISSGGLVSAMGVIIGTEENGNGKLVLDGPNAKLESPHLDVALSGRGEFTLQNGAKYTFQEFTHPAQYENSEATINVNGAGSELTFPENVDLGSALVNNSIANISVSSGGRVSAARSVTIHNGGLTVNSNGSIESNSQLIIGNDQQGAAQVTVQGNGARLNAGDSGITVGNDNASGTLTVQNGGFASASQIAMADELDAVGNVVVQGAGSKLAVDWTINVGNFGNASLLVQDSGSVRAAEIRVRSGTRANSASSLRILGSGSQVSASEVHFSESNCTLEVSGQCGLIVSSALELGGAKLIMQGGGINVGLVLGDPVANTIRVGPLGYFSSRSRLTNVENVLGTVQVGGSPGIMEVSGDYTQNSGSLLRFSIAGTDVGTKYSQLQVDGNLQLSGTLRFVFEDGFTPQPGQTFDVIQVGGTTQLTNYQVQVQNLAPGFQYDFAPIAGGYRLTALSTATFAQQFKPGDFNGDGSVTPTDIPAMLAALTNLPAYEQSRGMALPDLLSVGDLDGSGDVDNGDIQPLLNLVAGGGSVSSVPEQSSFVMASIATLLGAAICCQRFSGASVSPTKSDLLILSNMI